MVLRHSSSPQWPPYARMKQKNDLIQSALWGFTINYQWEGGGWTDRQVNVDGTEEGKTQMEMEASVKQLY